MLRPSQESRSRYEVYGHQIGVRRERAIHEITLEDAFVNLPFGKEPGLRGKLTIAERNVLPLIAKPILALLILVVKKCVLCGSGSQFVSF